MAQTDFNVHQERIDAYQHPDYWIAYLHLYRYLFARRYCYGIVLDACCGLGYGTHFLSNSKRIQKVVGVDIDSYSVRYALQKYSNLKTAFLATDLSTPTFPDKIFDSIVFLECLEHLNKPQLVLRNLHRILKSGGLIILSTPNRTNLYNMINRHSLSNPYHVREYSISDVRELMTCSGFEIIGVEGEALPPPFVMRLKFLRTNRQLVKLFCHWVRALPRYAFYQILLARA
ncbi:MAG: class I SAM-dependent methyltransferase [Candidatus Hodarchaeota archaeon]